MRKTIKKTNSKWILLFLFTFFSIGVQAQNQQPNVEYDENGQNHWSATAVGQLIANALTTSGSWQSAESFFVKDQEGNFVRIDFALEEVVISRSSSINFKFSEDEENLFYELIMLEPLTPEEQIQAHLENIVIPNCPKWYVWDGEHCVLVPESERRPCDKATIADHVYNTENGAKTTISDTLPRTTKLVSQVYVPEGVKLTDTAIGFNSALYKVDNGNGDIEYVYATQGTDGTSIIDDWLNNLQQAAGSVSEQYVLSVKNARALQIWAEKNGYKLSFTGHSLGGGMANANALATGLPATIYNPAGLNDNTITELDLDITNSKYVTAHVVRGEPLSIANEAFDTPVRGTTKYIGTTTAPIVFYGASILLLGERAGRLAGALLSYESHSMFYVIANLDCN